MSDPIQSTIAAHREKDEYILKTTNVYRRICYACRYARNCLCIAFERRVYASDASNTVPDRGFVTVEPIIHNRVYDLCGPSMDKYVDNNIQRKYWYIECAVENIYMSVCVSVCVQRQRWTITIDDTIEISIEIIRFCVWFRLRSMFHALSSTGDGCSQTYTLYIGVTSIRNIHGWLRVILGGVVNRQNRVITLTVE